MRLQASLVCQIALELKLVTCKDILNCYILAMIRPRTFRRKCLWSDQEPSGGNSLVRPRTFGRKGLGSDQEPLGRKVFGQTKNLRVERSLVRPSIRYSSSQSSLFVRRPAGLLGVCKGLCSYVVLLPASVLPNTWMSLFWPLLKRNK